MVEWLRRVRAILTMEAGEATERASLRYLKQHRRHPRLTNVTDLLLIGASFVVLWWAGGLRIAVVLIGGIVAAVIVAAAFFTILFIVRRHRRRGT